MDEKRLRDQLSKLGSTPFECDDINITIDDGITIPIKEINSVRRESVSYTHLKLILRLCGL